LEDVPRSAIQTELFYADEDSNAWNSMEIICEGMRIITFINGKRVTNFNAEGILNDGFHQEKEVGVKGNIALQLHSRDELLIRFKDLKIREY
jgi:hypothetical protein